MRRTWVANNHTGNACTLRRHRNRHRRKPFNCDDGCVAVVAWRPKLDSVDCVVRPFIPVPCAPKKGVRECGDYLASPLCSGVGVSLHKILILENSTHLNCFVYSYRDGAPPIVMGGAFPSAGVITLIRRLPY